MVEGGGAKSYDDRGLNSTMMEVGKATCSMMKVREATKSNSRNLWLVQQWIEILCVTSEIF